VSEGGNDRFNPAYERCKRARIDEDSRALPPRVLILVVDSLHLFCDHPDLLLLNVRLPLRAMHDATSHFEDLILMRCSGTT
jgi:hypothetical protein